MIVTAVSGLLGALVNGYQMVQGDYGVLTIVMFVSFLLIFAFAVQPILAGNTK